MGRVHSFEPLIGTNPRVLILGSMPSVISLQFTQYYGNPRNAFWSIMAELFDIEIDCEYPQRIEQIRRLPIVLWDTIKACHREGSLDSSILKHQLEANDIPSLLDQYSDIQLIAFNGATSEKYFKQLVKSNIPSDRAIDLIRFPSTSPANAGMKFEQKLASWKRLFDYI